MLHRSTLPAISTPAAKPRHQTRFCPSGGTTIHHPMPPSLIPDVPAPAQGHGRGSGGRSPLADPSALLRERFFTELAYYETDQPYLTADKCAARCQWLSQLLTAAVCTADESDDAFWLATVANFRS